MRKLFVIVFIILLEQIKVHGGAITYTKSSHLTSCKQVKDTAWLTIHTKSELFEFYKINYDSIGYLSFNIAAEDTEVNPTIYKLSNVKKVGEFNLNINHLNELDNSIFSNTNIQSLKLRVHTVDSFPDIFQNVIQLSNIAIKIDTVIVGNPLNLNNVLKNKKLLDFSIDIESQNSSLILGPHASSYYNSFVIGGHSFRQIISTIYFDSVFFDNLVIKHFALTAYNLINFKGSNSFAAFQLYLNSSNTKNVIEVLTNNHTEWILKYQNIYSTSIYIRDCSRLKSIPKKLMNMGYSYIKLYNANCLGSISNIDYNTTWPLHIKIQGLKGSRQLFSEITQNNRLSITLEVDKCKYKWIKHIHRIGNLDISLAGGKKLPRRVLRKLNRINKN